MAERIAAQARREREFVVPAREVEHGVEVRRQRCDGVRPALDRVFGAERAALFRLAEACDELVRLHVWLTAPRARDDGETLEPQYSFRHALVRQVLYERTPLSVRVPLHCEVGRVLESERAAGSAIAPAELAMHFDRGRQPMAALRWYAEAARSALLNFSPATCIGLMERVAALLPQAPQGAERDALEITLATLRGMADFQAHGVGDEARNAFQRAYTLLAGAETHPMRGRLLHGFGYLLSLRGDYAQALEVADRAEALSSGSDDPVLSLAACVLRAHAWHLQGRTQAARSQIERGLAIAEAVELVEHRGFMTDPLVTLLGMRAVEFVRSGLVQQCRAHVQRARAHAVELRQPIARLTAAWYEALVEVRLGNADRVATVAEEMRELVEEFALEQGRTACQWFRGWAEARKGRPSEGCRLIREACEQNTQLGMRAGASEVLGYAAEALLLAGDVDAAQAQLQGALQIADELGEKVYLPQLRLLEAAVARAQGRADAGAACTRRAIDEARALEAPWFELLALVDLCEHGGVTAEDRRALAALVDQLPEAAETALVRRARSLGSGRSRAGA